MFKLMPLLTLTGFTIIFILSLAVSADADSIEAEELEVPPPEWSIFYEALPPVPPVYTDPPEEAVTIEQTPPVSTTATSFPPTSNTNSLVPVPFVLDVCWFKKCGNNDSPHNPHFKPHFKPPVGPPGGPPGGNPIPEPGAGAMFLLGLGLLSLSRAFSMREANDKVDAKDFPIAKRDEWPIWMR